MSSAVTENAITSNGISVFEKKSVFGSTYKWSLLPSFSDSLQNIKIKLTDDKYSATVQSNLVKENSTRVTSTLIPFVL